MKCTGQPQCCYLDGKDQDNSFVPEVPNPYEIIVCFKDTLENNFRLRHEFIENLKKSCRFSSDANFSFKYIPKYAFVEGLNC